MRTKQLIASIRDYALSAKKKFLDLKAAARSAQEQIHFLLVKQAVWKDLLRHTLVALPFILLIGIVILLEESHVKPYEVKVNKAGFFEKEEMRATSSFVLDEAKSNKKALAQEALLWLSVLKSYDDFSLSPEQMMNKFKNMSIACTIISSTAEGQLRRRYWSERAIKYSRYSLGVLEGMMPEKNEWDVAEVNTRLLIAMTINYYEKGKIQKEELVSQFEKISKTFLVRTGFCNNRILKTLHDDRIIELPNYVSQKNT